MSKTIKEKQSSLTLSSVAIVEALDFLGGNEGIIYCGLGMLNTADLIIESRKRVYDLIGSYKREMNDKEWMLVNQEGYFYSSGDESFKIDKYIKRWGIADLLVLAEDLVGRLHYSV